MEHELPYPDVTRKRKPSLVQKFFAQEWSFWFIGYSIGAVVAIVMVKAACPISLRLLGNWEFMMWYIVAILAATLPLGFVCTLFPGSILWYMLKEYVGRLNGAPYQVGDHIQIIAGKHAEAVTTVCEQSVGQDGGIVLLVKLDEEAERKFTHAFESREVMRV